MKKIKNQANERTFQGILLHEINKIIEENLDLSFEQITQEENVGVGNARFADGLLYSSKDKSKKIIFELKNNSWDATDDELVKAAAYKSVDYGSDYFVTGTPKQLVIFKTLEAGKKLQDRKLKIFDISKIRRDDDVKTENYKNTIRPKLKDFLQTLSNIIHGIKEIVWDSIDKFFVNRLTVFISQAAVNSWDIMIPKINSDKLFKNRLKEYLQNQDIFNVNQSFEDEDIFNLCQLANYILYLKIIFYTNLQRNVPSFKLKPLIIPEDKKLLNETLKKHFEDVLKIDYKQIFEPTVIDEFEFKNDYVPVLKNNIEQVKNLNFEDLNADIIGAIYNNLLDNQEQHDRGQHFTNTNEVDIINAFCINENTKFVTDTSCGAGTFLVRAYQFLKYYNPDLTHEQLLEKVWGIEIATFPAFLAVMNLCLLDIKTVENYPLIIRSDFADIKSNYSYSGYFLNANKEFEVKKLDNGLKKVELPQFDACVGNPPYIRQELIQNKEEWNNLVRTEQGIKKLNQQSDFYVYYLMHTASFLKEGGRFGYVISSSWLDVNFGKDLQKFLLDNFKIVAIIDNQVTRSFETASINSVILILEKCSNEKEREKNNVKFIRVFKDYEDLIGNTWKNDRIEKVKTFVEKIENTKKNTENKNYKIFIINQKELEFQSTIDEKYENGNWGAKHLRSSKIYNKIIEKSKNKILKVFDVVEVKYGIKTGCNEFFYVEDYTDDLKKLTDEEYKFELEVSRDKHKNYWEKMGWFFSEMGNEHYEIERFYVKPLFKTQKEAVNLDVDISKLKNFVVFCPDNKKKLEKFKNKILYYIKEAENREINKRPTVSGRENWYDLTKSAVVGDFIFPSKIGEKFRLIDNRDAKVYCDKVNYAIEVKKQFENEKDIIFLILNSTLFRFFVDLFARQLTGAQTLSDVDVNVVEKTLIPNPELLKPYKTELDEVYKSLKSREQLTIFEEVKQPDRRKLDEIIFEAIGLEKSDVDELYKATCEYVANRNQKSKSVETTKKKQKFTEEEILSYIKERFPEVHNYELLIMNYECKKIKIPAWKAKFPKTSNGNGNLYGSYQIYFVEGNQQITLDLENACQIELLHFIIETLQIKDTEIQIPTNEKECKSIFQTIKKDYEKYSEQIKNQLKANRISMNYLTIYKEIFFFSTK